MGFPRQEYWSSLPFPTPGDLPHPRIKPASFPSSCIDRQILYNSGKPHPLGHPCLQNSFCNVGSGEVKSSSGLHFPWWNHHWWQKQTPSSWLCPPGAECPSGASVTLTWQGEKKDCWLCLRRHTLLLFLLKCNRFSWTHVSLLSLCP